VVALRTTRKTISSLSIKKGYRFTVLKAVEGVPFHRSRGYRFTVDKLQDTQGIEFYRSAKVVVFRLMSSGLVA
jgi:hypothetical protein